MLFAVLATLYFPLKAQVSSTALNFSIQQQHYFLNAQNFTSVAPLIVPTQALDSVQNLSCFNFGWTPKSAASQLFYNKSLFNLSDSTTQFKGTINPLFNFSLAQDFNDQSQRANETNFYTNTRGIQIQGNLGKSIYFSTAFYENQAFLVNYLHDYSKAFGPLDFNGTNYVYYNKGLIPGQGRAKAFKQEGWDYFYAESKLLFNPHKNWLFELGNGKHFIGEGYRSMLLSDFAFNYPYFKIQSNWLKNKIRLTNIYSNQQLLLRVPLTQSSESQFIKKMNATHLLDIQLHKLITLSLFETQQFQRWDSTGTTPLNPLFFNPIPFTNALYYTSTNRVNALVGYNLKIAPTPWLVIYNQGITDDLSRFGWQFGTKAFVKTNFLFATVLFEHNRASSYLYSNLNQSLSYSNFNQPLAHVWGAGFSEFIARIDVRAQRFRGEVKAVFGSYQEENNTYNFGKNVLNYFTTNHSETPTLTRYSNINLELAYVVNNQYNWELYLGYNHINRVNASFTLPNNQIITFGMRTQLQNLYSDF